MRLTCMWPLLFALGAPVLGCATVDDSAAHPSNDDMFSPHLGGFGGTASDATGKSRAGAAPMGGSDAQALASYPPGPYGDENPETGSVIENLPLRGFRRTGPEEIVGQEQAEDFWFEDLRRQGTYAFIHTATVWCGSCQAAADDLGPLGDDLSARGAVVIELVLEGSGGDLPTDDELRTWARGSDLTVTTARPASNRGSEVFASREYGYIVDLTTMQVVWSERALYSSPSIVERAAAALEDWL